MVLGIFYGLLFATVLFCLLLLFFWLGTKYAAKKPPDKVEDEVVRKQKQMQADLVKMMNYDVDQALGKKVT